MRLRSTSSTFSSEVSPPLGLALADDDEHGDDDDREEGGGAAELDQPLAARVLGGLALALQAARRAPLAILLRAHAFLPVKRSIRNGLSPNRTVIRIALITHHWQIASITNSSR